MEHLTAEQMERYATRTAGVDEILDIAQHLDVCDDCRDRAAALLEDDTDTRAHLGGKKLTAVPPLAEPPRRASGGWMGIGFAVAVIIVIAIALIYYFH